MKEVFDLGDTVAKIEWHSQKDEDELGLDDDRIPLRVELIRPARVDGLIYTAAASIPLKEHEAHNLAIAFNRTFLYQEPHARGTVEMTAGEDIQRGDAVKVAPSKEANEELMNWFEMVDDAASYLDIMIKSFHREEGVTVGELESTLARATEFVSAVNQMRAGPLGAAYRAYCEAIS
jgi:hypothetical protein